MYQWIAAKYALEMTWVLDARRRSIEQIIEEEQANRVQVSALSQMHPQAIA